MMGVGIIGRIFGSQKAQEGLIDGAHKFGKWIDDMGLSKEESLQYFPLIMQAYGPYKLAQRILAVVVALPYVLVQTLGVIIQWIVVMTYEPEKADRIISVITHTVQQNETALETPFTLVMGFYFAGGALNIIAGGKNQELFKNIFKKKNKDEGNENK